MPLQKCKFNTKQTYYIQYQLYLVVSISDSTRRPPEQATPRRSKSNATDREASDERENKTEQECTSHTRAGMKYLKKM
ncbi:unnamed protein product [Clavelina lepadiformis]|uniref:Uncharacterized protein n=1 Tax=Clavelina lepadiformis TaxID=159417 RepID=A0ABP0GG46_CLALP